MKYFAIREQAGHYDRPTPETFKTKELAEAFIAKRKRERYHREMRVITVHKVDNKPYALPLRYIPHAS